jgi:hypothetical protein
LGHVMQGIIHPDRPTTAQANTGVFVVQQGVGCYGFVGESTVNESPFTSRSPVVNGRGCSPWTP